MKKSMSGPHKYQNEATFHRPQNCANHTSYKENVLFKSSYLKIIIFLFVCLFVNVCRGSFSEFYPALTWNWCSKLRDVLTSGRLDGHWDQRWAVSVDGSAHLGPQ